MTNKEVAMLKTKVVQGASLLIIREFVIKSFALLGQLILYRVLAPNVFGIFAIIAFVVNLSGLFTDVGLTSAVIQKKGKISQEQFSSIFFLKFSLSFFLFLLIFFTAPLIIKFYPQLTSEEIFMLRVFSLLLLFDPLKTLLIAVFERNLEYAIITKIDIAGIVAYQIFAVFFALKGLSVWSLIFAVLIQEIVQVMLAL